MSLLHLKIVAPTGIGAEVDCDSIQLIMTDDKDGNSGGSIGIRDGFTDAMIAVAPGPIEARLAGNTVLKKHVGSGFATVRNNMVTVLADTLEDV